MYRDRRQYVLLRLKDQIWRERRFFFLVVAVLCAFIFYQQWAAGFYALKVNGVVVVWAKSRRNADELLRMVKQKEGGEIPPSVKTRFAEKLEVKRQRFTGDDIPALEEGAERLLPHLSLLVQGIVITVDGKAIVGVPSQDISDLVMKEVKRKLGPTGAKGDLVEDTFKEKVEQKVSEVPVTIFRNNSGDAVDLLVGKGAQGQSGHPTLTFVYVTQEWERSSGGGENAPARMVKVTYENGKEVRRAPVE
jgi:hypothetical protein